MRATMRAASKPTPCRIRSDGCSAATRSAMGRRTVRRRARRRTPADLRRRTRRRHRPRGGAGASRPRRTDRRTPRRRRPARAGGRLSPSHARPGCGRRGCRTGGASAGPPPGHRGGDGARGDRAQRRADPVLGARDTPGGRRRRRCRRFARRACPHPDDTSAQWYPRWCCAAGYYGAELRGIAGPWRAAEGQQRRLRLASRTGRLDRACPGRAAGAAVVRARGTVPGVRRRDRPSRGLSLDQDP